MHEHYVHKINKEGTDILFVIFLISGFFSKHLTVINEN